MVEVLKKNDIIPEKKEPVQQTQKDGVRYQIKQKKMEEHKPVPEQR